MRRSTVCSVVLFILAGMAAAQKPAVSHARLQQVSAASGLKPAFEGIVQKQDTPAWIGYEFPAEAREGRTMCCFESWDRHREEPTSTDKCCMGCRLESDRESSFSGTISGCSQPEPLPYAFVLFRVEHKKISRIRTFSPDCALNFGDLPLYWLENVDPAQSVELLTGLALAEGADDMDSRRSKRDNAIAAIALHDHPAADQALERLIQPGQAEWLRKQVVFWLGVERGKKGLELLRKYAEHDSSDALRKQTTFALGQNKEPEAIKDLIAMGRNDSSSSVRSQAIFWLAQIGGHKVGEQITDAIENDPETQVKKQAVFALTQMRDGEGIPLLINLAKTNKNPVVRKEAVRWLGMTNDPRALDFLEGLLTK